MSSASLTVEIAIFNITNQELEKTFRFQLDKCYWVPKRWKHWISWYGFLSANSVVLSFFLFTYQVHMFVSVLLRPIVLPFNFVLKGCESFAQLSLNIWIAAFPGLCPIWQHRASKNNAQKRLLVLLTGGVSVVLNSQE